MQLSGENECFVCGERIEWIALIHGSIQPAGRIVGEAVAVGKSEDNKTAYYINVSCPQCGNKNRFKTTGPNLL